MEWYHVWWPWLTSKRVARFVSDSWVCCSVDPTHVTSELRLASQLARRRYLADSAVVARWRRRVVLLTGADTDSPVVRCDQPSAMLAQMNVILTCDVKARPEVTALYWIIDSQSGTTIMAGDSDNDFWTSNMASTCTPSSSLVACCSSNVPKYLILLHIGLLLSILWADSVFIQLTLFSVILNIREQPK